MVNVIIYSTDKTEYKLLETFKYEQFIPIAYGFLENNWWFIYGNFDIEMCKPPKIRYQSTKKAQFSSILLNLCNAFGKHINSRNTDIEIQGVGKGSLIRGISDIIRVSGDEKYFSNNKHTVHIFNKIDQPITVLYP